MPAEEEHRLDLTIHLLDECGKVVFASVAQVILNNVQERIFLFGKAYLLRPRVDLNDFLNETFQLFKQLAVSFIFNMRSSL